MDKVTREEVVKVLGDIEVLTRPNDIKKMGGVIHENELLNDIGKLARAAIKKAKEE